MTGPEFEMQAYGDSDETKLDGLLLRWSELREQGQDVSAQEVCSTCPELAEELARRRASAVPGEDSWRNL